jgi:hypothetical protein
MASSKSFRGREAMALVPSRWAQVAVGSSPASLAPAPPVPYTPALRKERGYRKDLSEPDPSPTPCWCSFPSHAHSRPAAQRNRQETLG